MKQRRVLVIDDDAQTRDLLAATLGSKGYEVRCAEAGAPGITLAAAEPPDIVVLDLQMPGMDGYKVCEILRRGEHTRHIPIIMLTASDDPALNRKAYAAGAQACVPKPFRKDGLIAAMEAALAGMPRPNPER